MASEEWLNDLLLALTGTGDPKSAAARMADMELQKSGPSCPSIIEIAARYNVSPLIQETSYGPSGAVEQRGDGYVITLKLGESQARRRFTLAHELGHILISQAAGRGLRETTGPKVERFLDEFAGRLVLPEAQILDWAERENYRLSIETLERGSRELLVSIRVLVRRLGECGVLDRCGKGVVIGAMAKSRKARREHALRIEQVATPTWGFIPLNRRFSSVGLHSAEELFCRSGKGRGTTAVFVADAVLLVKYPPSYAWRELKSQVEQKVYRVRTGEQFVLVVFGWEGNS